MMRSVVLLLTLVLAAPLASVAAQTVRPLMPPAGQQAPPPAPAPAPAPQPPPDPGTPNRAAGIALPEPVSVPVDQGGFVKITATVAAGAVVSFDVATAFDGDVDIQTDQVGNTLYVGIPRKAGTIRVAACTVGADGKPTRIVWTLITVEGPPPPPAPPAPAPADPLAIAPGPHLYVTFLGAKPSDALRQRLVTAGCEVYDYASPPADRRDLADAAQRAGGTPAVMVQDDAGDVKGLGRVKDDGDVVRLVNRARGK